MPTSGSCVRLGNFEVPEEPVPEEVVETAVDEPKPKPDTKPRAPKPQGAAADVVTLVVKWSEELRPLAPQLAAHSVREHVRDLERFRVRMAEMVEWIDGLLLEIPEETDDE